jgi:hypothetical protein
MKWIRTVELPNLGLKTRRWAVLTQEGAPLGAVRWFSRWRCYAFYPEPGTIYERQCLRDLADFCEEQTQMHRNSSAGSQQRNNEYETGRRH